MADDVAAEFAKLDALFELGAQRLDTERNREAVEVFSGLVAPQAERVVEKVGSSSSKRRTHTRDSYFRLRQPPLLLPVLR